MNYYDAFEIKLIFKGQIYDCVRTKVCLTSIPMYIFYIVYN